MNIIHICMGNFTDGWSYQENLITKYHKAMGHNVSMITSQFVWDNQGRKTKTNETDYINDDGIHVVRKVLKKNILGILPVFDDICADIEKEKPDIIFIHNFQFVNLMNVVRYLKNNPSVTVFVDNHADYSNSATNFLSKYILHKLIWKFLGHKIEPYVTRFYGVLPARVDFLKELYGLPPEKCELLVMGADDDLVQASSDIEIRKKIRKEYSIADNDFLLITGGKIDAFKTQTLLLMEAVKRISNPEVKLIVFGSVADELKENVTLLSDGNRIQYIGWVSSADSYALFAASDLVVFPGRHSVFWEQVAGQGKPMIVKEWAGTKHVDLGGNVRFLKQDSIDEIQKEIEQLLNCPEEFERMKVIAEDKGTKVFSYNEIAKRCIRV